MSTVQFLLEGQACVDRLVRAPVGASGNLILIVMCIMITTNSYTVGLAIEKQNQCEQIR